MPADSLRPEDIDAAIAASQRQTRGPVPRLDSIELMRMGGSHHTHASQRPMNPDSTEMSGQADPGADDPGIPPYPGRSRSGIAFPEPEEAAESPRRRRLLPVLAGATLAGFAAIIWWAYDAGTSGDPEFAPLITAEEGTVKIRPENEGGLEVPYQDQLVYQQIAPESDQRPVERLLPPPETPMELPPAPAPAEPPAEAAPAGVAETGDAPAAEAPAPDGAPVPLAAPSTSVETATLDGTATPSPGPAPEPSESASEPAPPMPAAATETPPDPASNPATDTAEVAAPQVAAVPAGGFRIQLAALKSQDSAQSAWGDLQRRYPELLDPLQLTVVKADLGSKGVFYRVQAGPLPDRASAASLCGKLQERNQACLIVQP